MKRRLVILAILTLVLAACGRQTVIPVPAHSTGPLALSLDLQPTRIPDRYDLVITLRDRSGNPVDGAAVSAQVHYSYFGLKPGHVSAKPTGSGRYSAIVPLPSGSWWSIKADATYDTSRGHLEAQEDLDYSAALTNLA